MSKAKAAVTALELPSDLGIEQVAGLRELLSSHLNTPSLSLGGDEVERLHCASLQLLVAWFRARDEAQLKTSWRNPSSRLTEASATLGAAGLLHLEGTL